jgi:hypothetical protein
VEAARSLQFEPSDVRSIDRRTLASALRVFGSAGRRSEDWLLPIVVNEAREIVVDFTAVTKALDDHDELFLCPDRFLVSDSSSMLPVSASAFSDSKSGHRSSLVFRPRCFCICRWCSWRTQCFNGCSFLWIDTKWGDS